MKLEIWPLPFWSHVVIQIIGFLIIILPQSLAFDSPLYLVPLLVLEVAIFIPILYKRWKWIFYLGWELQFFLLLLFLVVFNYKGTFLVSDPHTRSIGFVAGFLIFLQILILAGFIFREKAVKPILITLSSSTALIVILLVGFVFNEGRYAFTENDPVEFITGTDFKPFYFPDSTREYKAITVYNPYDFELYYPDDSIYVKPLQNSTYVFTMINTGGNKDIFDISVSCPESVKCYLENASLLIERNEKIDVKINVSTEETGEFTSQISIISNSSGDIETIELNIISIDDAFSFSPMFHKEIATNIEGSLARIDYSLHNHADHSREFKMKVESPDGFQPYVGGNDSISWNFISSEAELEVGPNDTMEFQITPKLLQSKPGIYSINISVWPTEEPEKTLNGRIEFVFYRYTFIRIEDNLRGVDSEVVFPIEITDGSELTYEIENKDPDWKVELFDDNSIYITDSGEADINRSDVQGNLSLRVTYLGSGNIGDELEVFISVTGGGFSPSFGILSFIAGSAFTTLIAVAIAIPFGLSCAIFLAEYSPGWMRKILRPLLELLAGIPSVIYGLWGLLVFAPFLYEHIYPIFFDTLGPLSPLFEDREGSGRVLLTAGIVLAIMILPIIVTLSEDSIRAVSRELREGSIALGTTKWQSIRGVVLKKARSGIIASAILGTGRAIGETMAVLMIMRYTTSIPESLFDGTTTITGVMAAMFGDAWPFELSKHAIFGMGCVLFTVVFVLNTIVFYLYRGKNKEGSIFIRVTEKILKKLKIKLPKRGKKVSLKNMKTGLSPSQILRRVKFRNSKLLMASEYTMRSVFIFYIFIAVAILFLILFNVVVNGASAMKLSYLTEEEIGLGEGGFKNALVGSLYLVGISLAVSVPLSIGAAIYINEYAKENNLFNRAILFASDTLASTPSIVFGIFGFAIFVMFFKFKFTLMAGGLTLGVMVIPLLLRSSIEALKAVPKEQRDASLALGASKWKTILQVVLPSASGGILSGVILSIGRAIGETAAVIFTAGYSTHVARTIMSPSASMPNLLFQYYELSLTYPKLEDQLYAAALVLILVVLALNSIARFFQWRSGRMMRS